MAEAKGDLPAATLTPGRPALELGSYDLGDEGYGVEEYFLEGRADAYAPSGELAADGRWKVELAGSANYCTRIVVLRPSDPSQFNGTVVVEWLNVSGGSDGAADWLMAHRALMRRGYAWVGVSAQKVGVEGGVSLGVSQPLKKKDPSRYGVLAHPGDAYAYGIFSQAGRLVRNAGPVKVLGPLRPQRLIAAGESQSALFLTTYANAVAPLAKTFDGYLIHSRFGPAARLDGASVLGEAGDALPEHVKIRTDLDVPVLTVVTESDVVGTSRPGFWSARQPDTARLRTWEIAGAAHADTYVLQVGPIDASSTPAAQIAAAYAPSSNFFGLQLAKPVNSAPQHHYVIQAAIVGLDQWIRTGQAPPPAEPLHLDAGQPPALVVDDHGIARGGLRTPWVEVPTARLSGVGNSGAGALGSMFGITEVFDASKVKWLYPGGRTEYRSRFEAALDHVIAQGFLLSDDRDEILDLALLMFPGEERGGTR